MLTNYEMAQKAIAKYHGSGEARTTLETAAANLSWLLNVAADGRRPDPADVGQAVQNIFVAAVIEAREQIRAEQAAAAHYEESLAAHRQQRLERSGLTEDDGTW